MEVICRAVLKAQFRQYYTDMPQHQSAIKRVRQNKTRNERNRAQRSRLRTLVKNTLASTEKETALPIYTLAVAYLDKMVVRGIIHKNNAANKKSRLTKYINQLS